MNNFRTFLSDNNIEFKEMEPISTYSSIKIGGNASFFVFPNTVLKLIKVIEYAIGNNLCYKITGRMTNILPCDQAYNGVLISTLRLNKFLINNNTVKSESGALFSKIIYSMLKLGYGGAESLVSIPGTVGGMIYSNAGAYGSEISDYLTTAEIYDPLLQEKYTVEKDELQFGYRTSIFKYKHTILLSANFNFMAVDKRLSEKLIKDYQNSRKLSQPFSQPSLGCIFKKHNQISAGELIDKCGLKGTRIGGAEISTKHAGFIINSGNATSNDVKMLIELIINTVYQKYGIILENEIEFL